MCSPSAGKEATSPHGARAHWQRHDPLSPEGSGRLRTARGSGVSPRGPFAGTAPSPRRAGPPLSHPRKPLPSASPSHGGRHVTMWGPR